MRELGIDIETYSEYDLADCGVYRYVEAPGFTVLLFCFSVDHGPAQCVDLASGESLPAEILTALTDPAVTKTAYNATFERICLGKYLGLAGRLDPAQWQCTMARAARMGLPLSLAQCAEVLHLEQGKMSEGKALIRFFSQPDKSGRRRLQSADPAKWETFKAYCLRDVEVEQAVLAKVRRLSVPAFEDEVYIADQEINDRGVLIDRQLAESCARLDAEYKQALCEEAKALTGLDNPNSPAQLKAYLSESTRLPISTLNKNSLDDLEEGLRYFPTARRVLQIRREMGKTSNMKYAAMLGCMCEDGRAHGLVQYYGAPRTGRWAGRMVQVQNLPQNHLADIDRAREIAKLGDLDEMQMNYPAVTQTLSELIRTAFIAAPGRTFHVCDFAAIEARVIAWLAGEKWVLDVFRKGGDIYCATASQMFGVPVEKHGQNSGLRQKGKIAVLALGYGGGVAALEAMGGKRLGLTEQEERQIVSLWRKSNPRIVKLWSAAEDAAVAAIKTGREFPIMRGVTASRKWGCLIITLPSGRPMCYPRASIESSYDERRGEFRDSIVYEGLNQTTRKWETLRTYGGKLAENIVQATARDILATVMLRARAKGMDIVFHVHDEIVVEAKEGQTLQQVESLFSEPIDWCRDLPLKGAGYTTPYYLKD